MAAAAATTATKRRYTPLLTTSLSLERRRAEMLMFACIKRLGERSPAALLVCDTYLAHDFWVNYVHPRLVASEVWAWGDNRDGQLGFGDTRDRPTPTEVMMFATAPGRRVHAAACGMHSTVVASDDDELWAAGCNRTGQLGLGDTSISVSDSFYSNRSSFTQIPALSGRKVTALACGHGHTLALLAFGGLFAWGSNVCGQLGIGSDVPERRMPVPVPALGGRCIAAIACGGSHSAAVLETGVLFTWGSNDRGQLGIGDSVERHAPTQVTAFAGKRVVMMACGGMYTAAVLKSGELYTWGRNKRGQLGHGILKVGENTPKLVEAFRGRPVADVACGESHTLALLETGEVFAWGRNQEARLGLDGAGTGPISSPQQVHHLDGKPVRSVHCGAAFSSVTLKSGEMVLWGHNDCGQLGDDAAASDVTPVFRVLEECVLSVALGYNHVIALLE